MDTFYDKLEAAGFPNEVLVIDFENYYDNAYTLTKLQTIEYIVDPRFEFTGVGWCCSPNMIPSFSHDVPGAISSLQTRYGKNLEGITVVIANARYDATVLQEKFNIIPPYVIDIQDLARHYDSRMSHSIKDLAKMFGLEPKGDTSDFKGLHLSGMTAVQRDNLMEYCKTDIRIEAKLFVILMKLLTWAEVELPIARHTLGLYLVPRLNFDFALSTEIFDQMNDLLEEIMEPTGCSKKLLGSVNDFVMVLGNYLPDGEVVPYKMNKKGLKMIPALSKDDEEFQLLLAHKDERVRLLCRGRIAVKSWPLHINRVRRMRSQALASYGSLRVPLNYYGCHTGRPSGGEKINLLNLGGKGRKGMGTHKLIALVRRLLIAPPGKTLVINDSSQIEARLLAWLSDQSDLVAGFAADEDIYSIFASQLFGIEVRKPTDEERENPEEAKWVHDMDMMRGFGKDAILGCVAEGTVIRTGRGRVPIQCVTKLDKLWDGQRFVSCGGAKCVGRKTCVKVKGTWLTPEHEILTWGGWTTAVELSISSLKSGLPMESLLLPVSSTANEAGLSPSNVVAPVVESLLRIETIWSPENLHAVMCVLKKHPVKLRAIKLLCQSHTKPDFLTEFVQLLAVAKPRGILDTNKEGSESIQNGKTIGSCFLNTWRACQDGITQNLKSIGWTTIEDMNLIISDSLIEDNRLETRKTTCYDILNAGPLKRFQAGQMIVSNSGYGMGVTRFYNNCRANPDLRPLFDDGTYNREFIERLIRTYRKMYYKIPEFWREVESLFKFVIRFPNEVATYDLHGQPKLKFWNDNGTVCIQLPSGRVLYYRHSAISRDGNIRWQWGHLWGGSITENIIQSIGADLLRLWILDCEAEGIPVVTHCYDEIVGLVKEETAEDDLALMDEIMCEVPDWAKGCPMASEGMISKFYTK